MKNYEVTFIVQPVLSGDGAKSAAQGYVDLITANGGGITHLDETGLRPLAYPIGKYASGVYYTIEFTAPDGVLIDKMELTMRRDERLLRYLTLNLDKYGVKYNQDKRDGKIGKKNRERIARKKVEDEEE